MQKSARIQPNGTYMFRFGPYAEGGRIVFDADGCEESLLVTSFLRGVVDSIVGAATTPSMSQWDFGAGEVVTARVRNVAGEPRDVCLTVVPATQGH